ncbi:MAG: beta-propeller fold lactonase family protein [bacterium]|nr:beta-propeller fold lactonase family protein [bacterium]
MKRTGWLWVMALVCLPLTSDAQVDASAWPGPVEDGYLLPNGWRITPVGKTIATEDLLLQMTPAPDGRSVVAVHGGYNPHGLVVIDTKTDEDVQRIPLPTAWYGLAWSPDGARLYVSGANNKSKKGIRAPIYAFGYENGRLTDEPLSTMTDEEAAPNRIFWAGLAHHPKKPLLYAANRTSNTVTVFALSTGTPVNRIAAEQEPYALAISPDGATLYCSNWGSDSVSVIDTESETAVATIAVGDNPNDMVLARDGRLFVCCSNDNTVVVIDTKKNRAVQTIVTSMHQAAPEGSTPNALALDEDQETLYVANADNNNVCVIEVEDEDESSALGFIPAGWYPSAVAVSANDKKLYIGNAKGSGSYSNIRGPHSRLPKGEEGRGTVKSLMKGSINIVDIPRNRRKLRALTRQAYANCPYNDELLAQAPASPTPSAVPSKVGGESPIKHVIYILKENRTYDQVFGDLPQGNGDPRLCLFGRDITPNHHALAEEYVLFDNLYCDAEVSWDGHQWSNAAYATDFIEKYWPASYGGKSAAPPSLAIVPSSGYIWDQCERKGITYRSYGEFARRQSDGGSMVPKDDRLGALHGHVAPNYLSWGARDFENAAEFIKEFDEYDKHFDHPDANRRLPRFIVLALPEDHTHGGTPGKPTPGACVASNDYALGMIVDRVSHSNYWPETAVFVIEDDAQDGPDHVDARRTVGLVVSPYSHRGTVDSTFYTTCSMLRTMELLLGLPPMSQFDAAALPMYAALGDTPDVTPYTCVEPKVDIMELNQKTAWGAQESLEMDLSTYDRAPMFALNEIVWKSMRGADSEMPLPVHRFHVASLRNTTE